MAKSGCARAAGAGWTEPVMGRGKGDFVFSNWACGLLGCRASQRRHSREETVACFLIYFICMEYTYLISLSFFFFEAK